MARSRATIRDVAAKAGVSHQTVSRVINNSERVSPETRHRVEAAIDALGYKPNVIARLMAKGRTGTLACLAPNLTDYTFASIIEGAQREAQKCGYFLLATAAPDDETFRAIVAMLVTSGRTEGLLVINPYADGRFALIPPDFPVVFAGSRPRKEDNASSIALDDVKVAAQATQHLIDLGHKNIAMITGLMSEDCAQDRKAGFLNSLHAAGLSVAESMIIHGNWSAASGYEGFKTLVDRGDTPDAIFAQNDQIAAGVLKAAAELNLNIPQQLSVIGIDDIPMAPYLSPALTTLRQDFSNIGRVASQLLIKRIEKPSLTGEHLLESADFILRHSTAKNNGRS